MSAENSANVRNLRRLIWIYFILLVIEGALRKWVAPRFSNPLLVIRDPVALGIYFLAFRAQLWPRNFFVSSLLFLGVLSLLAGLFTLSRFIPLPRSLLISGYGFRSNFFHFPLVFLLPKVFDPGTVRRVGWWALMVMIPMALLMALQFESSPDSFINRTAGLGDAEQITAGGGKIRPPGTFSFISGAVSYVTVCAAFVLYGALTRGSYKTWLLYSAGFAVALAVVVSGSRSLALSVLIVVLSLGLVLLVRPSGVNRFGRILVLVLVLGLIALEVPIVREGMSILSDRFTTSAEIEDRTITAGLVERTLGSFTESFYVVRSAPLFGWGLGVGTNAAARSFGRSAFLLGENEWSRLSYESGPILGVAFILWRVGLALYLGYISIQSLRRSELLPLLLFSAGFFGVLNGQLGQPTTLGFAVVLGGLCLAAAGREEIRPLVEEVPAKARLSRGRSVYAERLHRDAKP